MKVSPRLERVRVPDTFPRERVVLGELHLVRSRLDEMLAEVAAVIARSAEPDEGWLRVEEAARLARGALSAAVTAVPARPLAVVRPGDLRVGEVNGIVACVDVAVPSVEVEWVVEGVALCPAADAGVVVALPEFVELWPVAVLVGVEVAAGGSLSDSLCRQGLT
jgi:hypothetical protein